MIRLEPAASILRFYPEDTDDPLANYTASCTLVYESASVVWVKGLVGELSRKNLRELLRFFIDNNICLVKTIRASGSLPYATKVDGNYCELDLTSDIIKFRKLAGMQA